MNCNIKLLRGHSGCKDLEYTLDTTSNLSDLEAIKVLLSKKLEQAGIASNCNKQPLEKSNHFSDC